MPDRHQLAAPNHHVHPGRQANRTRGVLSRDTPTRLPLRQNGEQPNSAAQYQRRYSP